MKKIIKYLSTFLAILFCIQVIPAISYKIFAADLGVIKPNYNNDTTDPIAKILYEDVSKRGENEKHFVMSDGTNIAVIYSAPVHYYSPENEWIDIDNSLIYEKALEIDTEDFNGYVNTASDFNTKFAGDLSSGVLLSINDELTFSLEEGSDTVIAEPSFESNAMNEDTDIFAAPEKTTSEIKYENVFNGADIVYQLNSKSLKEEIVINDQSDIYEYSYVLRTENLIPMINDDGSISIMEEDGENEKYTIPSPIMWDSADKVSDSVEYEINEIEQGVYSFKVIADAEWINGTGITFPVTIDPTVRVSTNFGGMSDFYIDSDHPDSSFANNVNITVGAYSGRAYRIYVNITSLPTLKATDVIVSSEIHYEYLTGIYSSPYYAYNVADSSWSSNTVTWNNQPQIDPEPLDYSASKENGQLIYDITRAVKEWYVDGKQTHGIMLKGEELQNYYVMLMSANGYNPNSYVTVNYRTNNGIDSDLSYTSVDAGEAGTVYVNNQTGLILLTREDITSVGQTMPFSISHVFAGSNVSVYASDMRVGTGWKLNIQEAVKSASGGYVYIDQTGNSHYFIENNGDYIDEDDLGMTFEVTSDGFTITFADDSVKTFETMGHTAYIISEENADGKTIIYTYDDELFGRIISVTDADGQTATFSYSGDYLSSITYNGRTISYTYGNYDLLTNISDSLIGGVSASYVYDQSNTVLNMTSMTDRTGLSVSIDYTDAAKNRPFNTESVKWKYSSSGIENGAEFSYNSGNSTTILYYGLDAVKNTDDDINTTYVFDYYGRSINVYNEDASGVVLGTNITGYSGTITLNGNNNISKIASTGVQNENMLSNDSYSFTATDNTVGISISTSEKYTCDSSVQVDITSAAGKAGIKRQIALSSGAYTFSAFVKSTAGVTDNIALWVEDISGNEIESNFNISKTYEDLDNGWERMYISFDLASSSTVSLGIGVDEGSGTIYVDAAKLERSNGFAPSAYNMLGNPGYENGSASWSGDGIVSSTDKKSGSYSVSISGNISNEKKEFQSVNLGYIPENSYVVAGWAKASSAMNKNAVFGLEATVTYTVYGSDGVTYSGLTKTTEIPFSKETTAWQYISGVVELPQSYTDNSITYTVTGITSITVSAVYSHNIGTAYFDDISLVQNSAVVIDYDSDGNIASVTVDNEESDDYIYESGGDKLLYIKKKDGTIVEQYIYDNDDNLIQVKDGDGTVIRSYTYDTNGKLLSATENGETASYTYVNDLISSITANGVTTSYSYDSNNRQTGTSKTAAINNVSYTLNDTAATYNSIGITTSETDSRGKTSYYSYDSNYRLSAITDAAGKVTRYDYTLSGNTSDFYVDSDNDGTLDAGESSVAYTYDACGRVSAINANGMAYTFTYNEAGLPYQIKVGNNAIATYAYTGDYSQRTSVTYANGLTESYEYDILGNVKEYRRGNTTVCTYDYDGNGNLIKKYDTACGKVTEYFYTAAGESLQTRVTLGTSVLTTYTNDREQDGVSYTDSVYKIGNTSYTYTTSYDEDTDETTFTLPTGAVVSSDEDIFGRKSTETITDASDNTILSYTYGYENRTESGTNYTSEAVSSVTVSDGTVYSYTYDDNGNILSVTRPYNQSTDYNTSYLTNGNYITTYEYDDLGELIRENNPIAGKTWTYTYDGNGNILTKKEYTYTTGTLPANPNSTKTYAYGNSTWSDQLTSYNGATITYDAQGNPQSWGDWTTVTWDGRRLGSLDDGDEEISFVYDDAGRRVKTVFDDSSSVDYVYDDEGKLIKADNLIYFYDESGAPIGFKRGSTYYYYKYNLQGDVTGLVSSSGDTVAAYEYDAWGNVDITYYANVAANSAAIKNIFRYRGQYGYVYDRYTGLYYLQTRYYDPKVGRFLNEDDPDYLCASGTTLGGNLYVYCENDAVNIIDPAGKIAITLSIFSIVLLAFLIALLSYFVLKVLLDSDFQRALNSAISKIGSAIKPVVLSIASAISSAFNKAKNKAKNYTYEKHHIVAKTSSMAAPARIVLRKRSIDINNSHNLVSIKYNLHKHLHTYEYYNSVNVAIKKADSSRDKVIAMLDLISVMLRVVSKHTP